MPRTRTSFFALAAVALMGAATTSDAASDGSAAAARGLDIFIHAPGRAAPRTSIPIQLVAYGFPTVVTLRPLDGADVEAVWDPETLGPKVSSVPPPVRTTTDKEGRAHLDVPIPDGSEADLRLLIGVRMGDRQRTREMTVHRIKPHELALYVPETRVVPGSSISTWVLLTSATTGKPVTKSPVEVSLLEGGIARHKVILTTDEAGTAMARVPIPYTEEPAWSWDLRARTIAAQGGESGSALVTLTPREETPGTPQLTADWEDGDVRAGDTVKFTARVRDGSNQPIANLAVRTWIGQKGTSPPQDKREWEKIATLWHTDAAGEIHGTATAPTTVVQGVGTTLQLVVKTTIEGHDLVKSDALSVENPTSRAELYPEAGVIVPGIEQRMMLSVLDSRYDPVSGAFTVEGDGLNATVTTDAYGEAEVTWKAPVDLGAFRNVGPCAGGVAAAVTIRPVGRIPALSSRRDPFRLCMEVDREKTGILRPDKVMTSLGDRVGVRIVEATGKGQGRSGPWSMIMTSANAARSTSFWLDEADKGGHWELPEGDIGIWSLNAALSSPSTGARLVSGGMLVKPRVLAKLTTKIAGGRAAPKGSLDIDLDLTDGKGQGLPGTVSALVVDLYGGGSVGGLEALDTRTGLCRVAGIEQERCDRFLEGDPAFEPVLRGNLGQYARQSLEPLVDPGKTAKEALKAAFGDVLRSLEGAIFQAAETPERLIDVRRKTNAGQWQFNPELMTLVTAAMDKPPETPGGEPLSLADLLSIDPQVTFDNVARRITRLKLFRVLVAMRAFKRERQLDMDEPALRDPNAMLRRVLRDGRIPESTVLDPWGGTIQFVKTNAAPFPFLTLVRGFELRAPGPDGRLNTADDVRDPFERILKSDTPYATAVDEDRIVDAKYDMEVGDATVSSWESLFEALTGTALGEAFGAGGLGLTGVGEGGGGRGEGIGLGSIGTVGHGRGSFGIPTGVAFWSPPRRTDANGHLRITVPLGDVETTWRMAFVGVPDASMPATATLDVPVALPLSVRVDTGASWIEGDEMSAEVTVRNRSSKPARATLSFVAGGVASLVDPKQRSMVVDVASGGAKPVRVRMKGSNVGRASLDAKVTAAGLDADAVTHRWYVKPAGEPTDMTHAQWVEGNATLGIAFNEKAIRKMGTPRVVLERGSESALMAALESMDPDRLTSPAAMADAIEVGTRMKRWATVHLGQDSALALRASEIAMHGVGRLLAYKQRSKSVMFWAAESRALLYAPAEVVKSLAQPETCPPVKRPLLREAVEMLDAEPAPVGGAVAACWDGFVTDTVSDAIAYGDRVVLARVLLALAERPHRLAQSVSLAERLRKWVELRESGAIQLPSHQAEDRSSRAMVYAALLRAAGFGKNPTPTPRLAAWVGVQRDVHGGYGSAEATRNVVRALLAFGTDVQGVTKVTIGSGEGGRTVEVGPNGRVVVPLDPGATQVELTASGPGLVARLERPVLRLWSSPPDDIVSPVHVEVEWPKKARAGKTGKVQVSLRHVLNRPVELDVRIPLPPGVSLAEPMSNVAQVQGVLIVRQPMDASQLTSLVEIPVRFALSGVVTVPEARVKVAFEEIPRSVAPARPLRIGD